MFTFTLVDEVLTPPPTITPAGHATWPRVWLAFGELNVALVTVNCDAGRLMQMA